jgi:AcrR family transcriptional regulator
MTKRPGLTPERIVATALDLADREGLEAVTLRRLAGELGVHVTSLYNHVPTKEAVLDGVIERLIADASLPSGAISWEEWVRHFAGAMRDLARRHPGAFEALHERPVQGPEATASVEAALGAFRAAGFDTAEAYSAVKATTHAVLGLVLEDLAGLRTPGLRTDIGRLPLAQFPNLHAVNAIAAEVDTWSYLIEALIAGFAASRKSARAPRRRGGTRRRTGE